MRNNRRDATSGAFSAFRVSEWSVRRKVVAVLAIPVVLAAVFGGLRVRTELVNANTYSTNQQRATVLGPAIDYLSATERLALPWTLSAKIDAADPTDQYFQAQTALKKAAAGAGLSSAQQSAVDRMLQTGDTVVNGSGTGITATKPVQLSSMTAWTTQLINSTVNTSGTPDPKAAALIQSMNGRLSLVKQQLLIQSAVQSASQLGSVWLAAEIGAEGTALANLKSSFGGHRVSLLTASNDTRLGLATSKNVSDLRARPTVFHIYDALNHRLLTAVQGNLATQASDTKTRALTDSAIILLALLASLLLALFVARALIVPLRKVRAGALDVANEKLPETVARIRAGQEPDEIEPIPVHSHEELGQLARAVDDMHKQAVNLATGEAQLRAQVGAMFVTLSRRNTTLVNQQLALIESLEQDEEDPQRLEQLFSLDHLATRMRRTAESLVILGGTSGRTASFEELSVSDVVHAAVSEVQDYQRVRIDSAPDRMIAGRAASDIVHLMAELIDNALSYSPPGSPVTIQAHDEDGKVEIQIIDNGLGMAGEALAQANGQLKNGGEVTVDTARRMGLFVVSRLAEEHGLRVKLRRNTNGGGIIASIVLPAAVLASEGPVEHVSAMDAPEDVEEQVAPVVDEEPEEEYDPYLERIEEAIAAVTGLPRRRPGQASGPAAPPAPAAAVSMFDTGKPELPAAFEPTELPGLDEQSSFSASTEYTGQAGYTSPPEYLGQPEHLEGPSDPLTAPLAELPEADESLALVVTPTFGADRTAAQHQDDIDDIDDIDGVAEPFEPVEAAVAVEDTDDSYERVDEAEPEDEAWSGDAGGDTAAAVATAVPIAEPTVAETPEPAYDAPAAVAAQAEPSADVTEPDVDAPVRLQIRRPLVAPAASALEGDFVADTEQPAESPIFGQLRSNWLSDTHEEQEDEAAWSPNEVDRGWTAAEAAESVDAENTTRTGLPVRRPGGRLLPGGVSQEPAKVVRDPEAIRNRLAAHAAGVSRGRAAAAAQPDTLDYAHEETGPA